MVSYSDLESMNKGAIISALNDMDDMGGRVKKYSKYKKADLVRILASRRGVPIPVGKRSEEQIEISRALEDPEFTRGIGEGKLRTWRDISVTGDPILAKSEARWIRQKHVTDALSKISVNNTRLKIDFLGFLGPKRSMYRWQHLGGRY